MYNCIIYNDFSQNGQALLKAIILIFSENINRQYFFDMLTSVRNKSSVDKFLSDKVHLPFSYYVIYIFIKKKILIAII